MSQKNAVKINDNGTKTNGYHLAINTFILEIRRTFLNLKTVRFWNNLPIGVSGAKKSNYF